jgi:hypothetical protein
VKTALAALAAVSILAPARSFAQHGGHGAPPGDAAPRREREPPPRRPAPPPRPAGPQQWYLFVDDKGFLPETIPLEVGRPAEITVLRRTENACAGPFVVPDLDVRLALEVEQPRRFAVHPTRPGRISFSCEGGAAGEIVVREGHVAR